MSYLGAFLFYFGLINTVLSLFFLVLQYSGKIGIIISKKTSKNSHNVKNQNEAMVNEMLKSSLETIAYRLGITIIGYILLLIYWPEMLPWNL